FTPPAAAALGSSGKAVPRAAPCRVRAATVRCKQSATERLPHACNRHQGRARTAPPPPPGAGRAQPSIHEPGTVNHHGAGAPTRAPPGPHQAHKDEAPVFACVAPEGDARGAGVIVADGNLIIYRHVGGTMSSLADAAVVKDADWRTVPLWRFEMTSAVVKMIRAGVLAEAAGRAAMAAAARE